VPRKSIRAAFGPSLAHYSAPNESIGVGENLFARSSALLRISPVLFVRQFATDPGFIVAGGNLHERVRAARQSAVRKFFNMFS